MSRKTLAVFLICLISITAYARTMLINTAFTVRAGEAKYWQFHVGSNGANVRGRFRAEGGGGNDIECYILDSDGLENWLNGHQVNTYYNSGRVTVANINVNLGEGDYAIVFNNKFSAISNKAVTATVELR
jgi:hypothetical protein